MVVMLFILMFSSLHGSSNGALDITFNPNGAFPGLPGTESVWPLTNYSNAATSAFAEAMVVDTNGKIVAAGGSNAESPLTSESMTLMRLNDDGSLDTTLNPVGTFLGVPGVETIWTASFGTGSDLAQANGIGLLSDGRIALAGVVHGSPANPAAGLAFAAVLLHGADGSLDTTFNPSPANVFPGVPGVEAIWTVSFGAGTGDAGAMAIAIQANDMLVLAGLANPTAAGGTSLAVARLTTTGALDPNFNAGHTLVGGPGTATIPLANFGAGTISAQAHAVAIQQNQKIVAVGFANQAGGTSMIAVRLTTTGGLDDTFGGIGGATAGITVVPNTIFGASADTADAVGVAIQLDGKILLAGFANTTASGNVSLAIVRLTAAGAIDTSFNGNGALVVPLATLDPSAINAELTDIAIQSDGKIVAAGNVSNTSTTNTVIIRVDTNGTLDPSFAPSTNETGSPGIVIIPLNTSQSSTFNEVFHLGLTLDAQERIVLAGDADPSGDDVFFFARLAGNAAPTPSATMSCIAQAIIAKYC